MALLADWFQPASGDAAINVPASTFRMAIQGLMGGSGASLEGVIAPTSSVVTQRGAGANFSVDIQPFQAIIAGEDITDQGAYLVTNTSVFNLVTPTAPGSGTRTHRLVAQVRDKRANASWSTYDWTPVIVVDSGSGEQSEPASSETLAHITIAAGQANVSNTNITPGYQVLRSLQIFGPWRTIQAGAGSWNSTNAYVAYSAGNWAPVTFTVPPSGQVCVTISGGLINVVGNQQISIGISGTDTRAPDPRYSYGTTAVGTSRGSRRTFFSALTPGGTDVVTPYWYQGQAGNSDSNEGELLVEAVQ